MYGGPYICVTIVYVRVLYVCGHRYVRDLFMLSQRTHGILVYLGYLNI